MSDEFTKSGRTAVSTEGFSIEVEIAGGVIYRDATNEVRLGAEWLMTKPFGIAISKRSRANKGLEGKDQAQIGAVFDKVIRALQFMEYRVEVDEGSARPRIFNPQDTGKQ
jgi:hypothetical protein